jgi:transcriptional regulator GlxA family with amidase domain
VEHARLDAATRRVEQGAEGLEQVARTAGLGTGLNLGRVCEQQLPVTRTEYHKRFGSCQLPQNDR